jgi:hypothetical protein
MEFGKMMNTEPEIVLWRINRPHKSWCVVPRTTPVPFFGNIEVARCITIGINPSFNEFLSYNEELLVGKNKRLEDFETLSINEDDYYEHVGLENAVKIYASCISYFKRNPYSWFQKIEDTVNAAFDCSYYNDSAAHLDLVQWATKPVWSELEKKDPAVANHLIDNDKSHLIQHLHWLKQNNSNLSYIFLSGGTVVRNLSKEMNLRNFGKTKAIGKFRQNDLYVGDFEGIQVFGSTMNVSDSYTSNAHRTYLKKWLQDKASNGRS